MTLAAQDRSRSLQDDAIFGILLMIGGLAFYALSDALIKHLMSLYSVPQTTFLRAFTRLLPFFIATFFQGGPLRVLSMQRPKRHLFRLVISLIQTYCFMYAFSICSLTSIYTLSYASSLFTVILSALILSESVGKEKWMAVAIGMAGVIIAIRPGSSLFETASLLVLCGAFFGALNKILMRRLAATEHSLSIVIYPNLLMVLVTLPFLLSTWQPMPLYHWSLFAIVGLIAAASQYAIAQGLRFAQSSTLAPFDYSSFFWVVALDFFWWHEKMELYTLLGATIIVGSNLFIIYCTRRDEKRKASIAQPYPRKFN